MNLHEIGMRGRKRRSEASLGDALDRAAGNGKAEVEDAEVVSETPSHPIASTERALQERAATDLHNHPALIERERALRPYEDGEDYNLARITRRIQESGVAILEHMVSIGKYLIWVKESEDHGDFLKWLDRELNMSSQRASEFMRMAHRVIQSKVPLVRDFLRQVGGDNKKKLLALLDVSDEEIQEAMQTDSFLGKKLDEVEAMSYRQMQAELRKEKDRRKKSDAQAKELEHEVTELREKVHNFKHAPAPKPPKASDLEPWELQYTRCMIALGILEKEILRVIETEGDEGHRRRLEAWQSAVGTLSQKVTSIANDACPEDMFLEQLGILPAQEATPDPPAEG